MQCKKPSAKRKITVNLKSKQSKKANRQVSNQVPMNHRTLYGKYKRQKSQVAKCNWQQTQVKHTTTATNEEEITSRNANTSKRIATKHEEGITRRHIT